MIGHMFPAAYMHEPFMRMAKKQVPDPAAHVPFALSVTRNIPHSARSAGSCGMPTLPGFFITHLYRLVGIFISDGKEAVNVVSAERFLLENPQVLSRDVGQINTIERQLAPPGIITARNSNG